MLPAVSLRLANQFLQMRLETGKIPDDAQANAIAVEFFDLLLQRLDEKLHQQADFFLRAPPVFGGKREQGQIVDATFEAGTHHLPNQLDTLDVAGNARRKRFLAHRPLPSMMTATCCGIAAVGNLTGRT